MLNQIASDWLTARGLDLDLAAKRGLYSTSGKDGEDNGDDRSDRLAVPYFVGDTVVNVKIKKLRPKGDEAPWLSRKGGQLVFWNRDAIADPGLSDQPLIITEGEWDALAALQAGFQRVVSVPNGAPDQPGNKAHEYVDEAWDDLERVERIILCLDDDRAGHALRQDLLVRLGRARCMTVNYPKGCKDLGDALRIYGEGNPARGIKAVRQTIENAKLIKMDGLFTLDELPEDAPLNPFNPRAFGDDLRKHIGICRSHLSFWTGEPGGGKTTLLRAITWAAATELGWRTAAAFFEDKPRRDTVKNLRKLWGNGWPGGRLDEADDFIRQHYRFIVETDRRKPTTINWFLDQADAAVRRYGCDMIIADPWSQFALPVSRDVDKTDAILQSILELKRFAEDMDVHVAVIAHPTKHGEWSGTKRMPDGDAISGSKDFRARCDLGVSVQADPTAKFLTNVKVWKVRDREEQGDTGEFSLLLNPESKRFAPLHPDDADAMRGTRKGDNVVAMNDRRRADIYE